MALPRLIDVEEFFADPVFTGAVISPDGKRLAYLAPAGGRRNVWVRDIDADHADAVCVTHDSRRGISRFQWTDDPRWLLYQQDTDGNEDWHVYRIDLENPDAAAVDLTPMGPGSRVLGVSPWKQQPGTVLVSMNKRPLYVDAFLIDVATGEQTVLHENPSQTESRLFGPTGRVFSMAMDTDTGAWEFFSLDDKGGRRRLYSADGPSNPLGVGAVDFTPDGNGLLLTAYHADSDDLSVIRVDVESGDVSVFAAREGSSACIASMVAQGGPPTLYHSAKTDEVIAVRFVGARPVVEVVDPAYDDLFDALTKLSDGVLGMLNSDKAERFWVATFVHDREPGLTYLFDRETKSSRLLFRPYPALDAAELAPMTPVSFQARDGLLLHGFLTLPVGVEPSGLPLVINVHGGPWFHDQWGYNPTVQFLANRGYAVLQVNFRGSSGYGRRHTTAAIHQFAGTMHDDLIDGCDWAVKQGYADPTRIAIYGGSYGGYAALVGVTFTPDYFAAAVDYCGISSLVEFMDTLPEVFRPMLKNNFLHYVGDPHDPEQLPDILARSPLTKVDQIVTPLLVVQGANDVRVVKAEADNIVAALEARGVPVEYLLADDEGHGFQNPENNFRMYRAVERHFGTHLGGRTSVSA